MKKKGRNYIPALAGEFLPISEIRSRAQEHFLEVVMMATPEPLYFLRDQVLPKFQPALDIAVGSGKSLDEIKSLSIFVLLDFALPEESADLKSLPEYQVFRDSSFLIYAAIEELFAWSKRFNLRGKRVRPRQDASPEAVNLARMDSVWPLVAALETILQWYFLRGKAIETVGGVPLFRSKRFIDHLESEDLPPIQLRTVVFDRRGDVPGEIFDNLMPQGPSLADPREVNTLVWQMKWEPESHFRDRVLKDFRVWLNRYIADRKRAAQSAGLVKGLGKRELSHFEWAAKYQIDGKSAAAIAKENRPSNVTKHAVEKAVQGILDMIRLEPRDPKPGHHDLTRSLKASPNRSETLRDMLLRVLAGGA